MKIVLCITLVCASVSVRADENAVSAARAVMTEFMSAFNARDTARWAETLHFPHVRFASNGVQVSETKQSFVARADIETLAKNSEWHHSQWDAIEVIHAAPDKVHFKVKFSRFNAEGERYVTYDSLYILQNIEGRWGIRARSSFAP